jgi:hypothetical protein
MILEKGNDKVASQTFRVVGIGAKGAEVVPIVPPQALQRSEPEEALIALDDLCDIGSRNAGAEGNARKDDIGAFYNRQYETTFGSTGGRDR